jgi:hypothetical protein
MRANIIPIILYYNSITEKSILTVVRKIKPNKYFPKPTLILKANRNTTCTEKGCFTQNPCNFDTVDQNNKINISVMVFIRKVFFIR